MPGLQEWMVIAFVALVVLGPDRLPRVARTAGELVARFRSETRRNVEELKRIAEIQDLERELQGLRQELRGTRDDIVSSTPRTSGARPATPGPRGRVPDRRAGARRASIRPDDAPPPIDPEAT